MKAVICEMCNSNQMRKDNGCFVCQNCGTQYTLEEAQKLLVEIEGGIKIDKQDEISNLYVAARNARQTSDYSTALADYEILTRMDPNNWEPVFYSVLLKAYNITNAEIANAAARISNCLSRVFEMIKESYDTEAQKPLVKEVADQSYLTAAHLIACSHGFRDAATGGVVGTVALGAVGFASSSVRYAEDKQRGLIIANIMLVCADAIEKKFDGNDPFYCHLCLLCYQMLIKFHYDYKQSDKITGAGLFDSKTLDMITRKTMLYKSKEEINSTDLDPDKKQRIIDLENINSNMQRERDQKNKLLIIGIVAMAISVTMLFLGLPIALTAGADGAKEAFGGILVLLGIISFIIGLVYIIRFATGIKKLGALNDQISQNKKQIEDIKRS